MVIVAILFLSLLLFSNDKTIIQINDISIQVEVSDTQNERTKGLSGKENLGNREGMLFVFDNEDLHGIWMKDMNFPIDILWINEDYEIVDIKENAKPESFPEIFYPRFRNTIILNSKYLTHLPHQKNILFLIGKRNL